MIFLPDFKLLMVRSDCPFEMKYECKDLNPGFKHRSEFCGSDPATAVVQFVVE